MIEVPFVVRNKAVAIGQQGWLDSLPALLRDLEHEWGIAIGSTFPDSTEALVVAVTLGDGTPAVLKLMMRRDTDANQHEMTVLRLAAGDACAEVLRYDPDREALLLERLGPSLHDLALPLDERLEILCGLATRVWRPAHGHGLPTGAEKGSWLIEFITRTWEELDRPCTEQAVDYALRCAASRIAAHDDERAVLVHGDIHEWNALSSTAGFKLVDPDGLLAEAEYDLGVLMREDPLQLLDGDPHERSRWLARRCGLDEVAAWEWGAVERVSTGLLCTKVDLQPVGRQMLAAAGRAATWP